MKYFTKKRLRKIKWGDHDALMDAIEYLIDIHKEENYDMGYQSCIDDLEVYSERLANKIINEARKIGFVDNQGYHLLDDDQVEKIIKDFFNDFKIENDGRK